MKKKLKTCIAIIVTVGMVFNISSLICSAFLMKLFIDYTFVTIEIIRILRWGFIISSIILIIFFCLLFLFFFYHIKCINSCFINYFSSRTVLTLGIGFQILIFIFCDYCFIVNGELNYRHFNSSSNTSETYDIEEKIESQLDSQFQNETDQNSSDYLFKESIHQKINILCISLIIAETYNTFALFLFYCLSKKYSDETASSISEPYSNLMDSSDLIGYNVPKVNDRNIINEPLSGIDFNG